MAQACSNTLYSSPVAQACSNTLYSSPVAQACSNTLYSSPVAQACSNTLYSSPVAQACSNTLYSSPVAQLKKLLHPLWSYPVSNPAFRCCYNINQTFDWSVGQKNIFFKCITMFFCILSKYSVAVVK